jgi:NADH-quinone oxidoreductase subunit F
VKNPGVYEIELGLSVYEFMNSDEYLGGMSSDRPLKALVPGGSSVPILPADLIYKTANGEDRLMTYESLSDGGFATGSMLGSGGFIVYNDTSCIVRNTWNFARFIITKAVDNAPMS